MSARDEEIGRGRVRQLTVLRVLIFGQLVCSLATLAPAGLMGCCLYVPRAVAPLLGVVALPLALLSGFTFFAAYAGLFFGPPLVLILVCTRSLNWKQRLAGLGLEVVAWWATVLALSTVMAGCCAACGRAA